MNNVSENIKKLSTEAMRSCGLSDYLYTRNFSNSINSFVLGMSDEEKSKVIKEAEGYGYETEDFIRSMTIENESRGLCCHGLDPDCCPAGCGDLDTPQ